MYFIMSPPTSRIKNETLGVTQENLCCNSKPAMNQCKDLSRFSSDYVKCSFVDSYIDSSSYVHYSMWSIK